MASSSSLMIDAMGVNSDKIPRSTPYVQAYVTGIDGVPWNQSQVASFSQSIVFRMAQNGGPAPDPRSYHGVDVENRAYTPQEAAQQVDVRVRLGIPWTTIYGGDAALAATSAAVQAYGSGIWIGHVNCILADWDLNLEEATARIGSFIHGMTCVGVQWASPSSNPNTKVPGSDLTLSQANCDLNAVDPNWRPDIWNVLPSPPPPPPPTFNGLLVTVDSSGLFKATQVVSTDDLNWHG